MAEQKRIKKKEAYTTKENRRVWKEYIMLNTVNQKTPNIIKDET